MTENTCSIIIVEIERIKNQVKNLIKKKIIHTNKTTDMNSRTQLYNTSKVSTQTRYYVMYKYF